MKNLYTVVVLVLLGSISRAQLPDNRINLSIGYSYGFFSGGEVFEESSLVAPSLFSNYNRLMGFTLKCFVKPLNCLSIGIGYNCLFASDWEAKNYHTYDDSRMSINSFSPAIQFHTKYAEHGIFNRLKLNAEIGTAIGPANIKLENPVLEIHGQTGEIPQPMTETNIFYGLVAGAGFELVIRNQLGAFGSYTYHQNRINPRLYADNSFSYAEFSLGLKINLAKDKHYYN